MGIYIPGMEIPKEGYLIVRIYANGEVEGGKLPGFMGHRNEVEAIRNLRSLGYKNKYERELEEIRNRQFWEK